MTPTRASKLSSTLAAVLSPKVLQSVRLSVLTLKPLAKENAWAGVAANRIGDGYRDISAYEWSLTCRLLPETAAEPIPEGESPSVGDE